MRYALSATLGATLGLWLFACAGGDLPGPSAPTDPANPKGPIAPFDSGANPLTSDLSAAPAHPGMKR
jgi:hypothetical protein